VRFTNTTIPDALAYLWFFGMEQVRTQHDPEHHYPNEGNYKYAL